METLSNIRSHIEAVRSRSALAADKATLLGVSKGQSLEKIAPFIEAGLTQYGENQVQEAASKWPALKKAYPGIKLHLIGPLQTNKVRPALELFDVIQTLDRTKLIDEIAKHDVKGKRFFVQVNIGEEPQKAGVAPSETKILIEYAKKKNLNVVGLMCIPPADDMPAPHFALLKKIAEENNLSELSMGMSSDYETAIRMGSTCVRVGTALFGKRLA